MAYTQTDLDNLKAAAIVIGVRGAVEVEINGRRVKYTSLITLQTFIQMVETEVNQQEYGSVMPVKFVETTG